MTTVKTTARGREANPWLVLLVLCLGFFMIMLDTTIVNIALPAMLDGLGSSLDQIVWVVNAYLLSYATLLITGGRLGDIFGPRNLFVVGLVVFTGASVACGLSDTATQMITARVIQGIGGALLTPQTLAIVNSVFPQEKRGAAMGVWSAVIGSSTIAGPTLGGVLVDQASWRWIFYVNVPVGLLALVGTFLYVPDIRPGRSHRLDVTGVLLASAGLFLIVFGLVEGQRYDWGACWGPVTIWEIIGAGAAVLIAFVLYERRPAEPLLPLALFRNRVYSVMNGVQALVAFGILGIYLPVILFLQSVVGMSAIHAGLTLAPWSLATIFAAPMAGRLADRYGGKWVLASGLLLFGGGIALMIPAIRLGAGVPEFLLPGIVAGAGLGLSMAPMTAEAMREIQPQQVGAASGMFNAVRQVGSVIGSSVVGAVLQHQLASHLASQARARTATLRGVPDGVKAQFLHGYAAAGSGGLDVAPGQDGGVPLPKGQSAGVTAELHRAAHDIFVHGYVDAVKPTIAVPAAVVLVGALCALLAPGRRAKDPAGDGTAAPAAPPEPAAVGD
ncbi:DHA2 family efflux MFS transporter permease subunit [Actinacidiphila yeochonensis]|uniref:DHA2 family efflux MFS transporter permease subunit n=1 Tax=Actinacidiphila yeochonensis TaxID=89050 RepID=UPI0006922584|nr:DHA2 family efflux MFS transporter permease subunit [Actinacidiphila yeochonensis]